MRELLSGNVAAAEGALAAGCRYYYGYPITPQNEVPAHLSKRMREVGGTFIQAESELAAISMVHGSAAAGARAMTSSSSPGISLKQEGISYLAGSELPAVVLNVQRAGPGLGDIRPAQSDYFQATRGGGHGDYRVIVLAPASCQEMYDFTAEAFDLADKWRIPVMVLADGQIGQMMEPVDLRPHPARTDLPPKTWALTGATPDRERRIVKSFFPVAGDLVAFNEHLREKHAEIESAEARCETWQTDDAEVVIVAYGTMARVARDVVREARAGGLKAGLLRPVTLWPFPTPPIAALAERGARFLVVEMSLGQMVEDVRLAVNGRAPVRFFGIAGGAVPTTGQVLDEVRRA